MLNAKSVSTAVGLYIQHKVNQLRRPKRYEPWDTGCCLIAAGFFTYFLLSLWRCRQGLFVEALAHTVLNRLLTRISCPDQNKALNNRFWSLLCLGTKYRKPHPLLYSDEARSWGTLTLLEPAFSPPIHARPSIGGEWQNVERIMLDWIVWFGNVWVVRAEYPVRWNRPRAIW